jgi:hypothetical protein
MGELQQMGRPILAFQEPWIAFMDLRLMHERSNERRRLFRALANPSIGTRRRKFRERRTAISGPIPVPVLMADSDNIARPG